MNCSRSLPSGRRAKAPSLPIVLFDKAYWRSVIKFDALLEHGMISERDRELVNFADTAEEVWTTLIEKGLVVQTLERGPELGSQSLGRRLN